MRNRRCCTTNATLIRLPGCNRKLEALGLKSQTVAHSELSRLTGSSSTTLTSELRADQEGGIEALKAVRVYRPEREVGGHQERWEA